MGFHERVEIKKWGGTAVVTVEPDDDMDDPRETGRLEGRVEVFQSRESFRAGVEAIFGEDGAPAAVDKLVAGEVVWVKDRPYVGVEKYKHGRVAYAACRRGDFPDREWDVSPIVGVWSPENRVSARRGALADARRARRAGAGEDGLRGAMDADLIEFAAWANGDGLVFRVEGRTGRGERFSDGPFDGYVDGAEAVAAGKVMADVLLERGAK